MAGAAHHNFVIRLYEGLLTVFHKRDDVCVVAEVTWFGPDGRPFIPDVAVIHGVAQSEPSSWRQDRGDPPASVVIEVVSASETDDIVFAKLARFNDAGVEEAWFLRTRLGHIGCYRRVDGVLRPVVDNTSALLGNVRFEADPDGSIVPLFANGEEFPSHFVVILARAHRAEAHAATAEAHADELRAQLRAAGITPAV